MGAMRGILGGPDDWGRVKYSLTEPATSNAGLLAATLATYSYFNKTGGLADSELDDPSYQAWVDVLAGAPVDGALPAHR
ncbi:MAG TPA: hypothetical protein VFG99_03250 [Chloroflexia bacterium]|nr:hypothetical protein [Chloroflexia bacterium]